MRLIKIAFLPFVFCLTFHYYYFFNKMQMDEESIIEYDNVFFSTDNINLTNDNINNETEKTKTQPLNSSCAASVKHMPKRRKIDPIWDFIDETDNKHCCKLCPKSTRKKQELLHLKGISNVIIQTSDCFLLCGMCASHM